MKQLEALRMDIAKLNEALASITAQAGPGPAAAGGAPGAAPGGQMDPNEQAEIEALLAQLHGEGGEGGAGAEPEPAAPAAAAPKPKKMSRYEAATDTDDEVQTLKTKLRRMEVVQDLTPLGLNTDDTLVGDMVILPPDVYSRQLDRLKLQRPAVAPAAPSALATAVRQAAPPPAATGKRKLETEDQKAEVVRLAASKGVDFFQAKAELGYE